MNLNSINNMQSNEAAKQTENAKAENKTLVSQDKNECDITVPTAEKEAKETASMNMSDKINYWKDKYKKIYCTTIDDTQFIWRRINRAEYYQCAFQKFNNDSKIDMFEKQYLFCKIGVLYPENVVDIMDECAGIAPILSDEIIYKSGFGDAYPKTKGIDTYSDIIEDTDEEYDDENQ